MRHPLGQGSGLFCPGIKLIEHSKGHLCSNGSQAASPSIGKSEDGSGVCCALLRNLFIITVLLGWPQSSFWFFHNTGKNPENKTLPYEVHDYCHCSVTKLCPTLRDLMDCSLPGFPVLHHLAEFAQIHVHCVSDAIQPSHLLSPPSPLALNLSQHQGLFQ